MGVDVRSARMVLEGLAGDILVKMMDFVSMMLDFVLKTRDCV